MPFFRSPKKRFTILLTIAASLLYLSGCASREERIQKLQLEASDALFEDQSERAISILSKGLNKYPDSNEIRIALSRALLGSGEIAQSVTLLQDAIKQDPTRDELWVKIGELEAQRGESLAAIQAFESYLINHGDDFLAWKAVTIESEKAGNLTSAIKAATRWNSITPSAAPALKLGELFLKTSNIPQARSWLSQGAAYAKSSAAKDALAELIKLEVTLKQLQQAAIWLNTYEQRYGSDNSDPRIQESMAVLENWKQARQELADAAAIIEGERRELEKLALAEREAQLRETQLAATTTTIEAQPDTEPETPASTDRPPETLFDSTTEVTETTTAQSEEIALSTYESAMAAHESGDYNEAISLLWELVGENAGNAQLWYHLSTAYYAQQNWLDAEACVLEAKRRAPRSAQVAHQYARTISKTQSTVRALEEIKALRLLFPRHPGIAFTLAKALRDGKAARVVISSAYQDFLTIASRNDFGYEEATQYVQSGR